MAEDRKKVWEKVKAAYEAEMKRFSDDCEDDFPHDMIAEARFSMIQIMEVQRRFQSKCKPVTPERQVMFADQPEGYGLPRAGSHLWREMMRVNILAQIAEMIELLETCPWKPWKNQGDHAPCTAMKEEVLWEARLEIIDAFCFMMNCWMLLGGTGSQFAALYLAKMGENHRRQKEGY